MDLTNVILNAYLKKNQISVEIYLDLVYELPDSYITWDSSDGEQWGIIHNLNYVRKRGIFHAFLPLIFVDCEDFNNYVKFFQEKVVVFEVQLWNEEIYSLNISKVKHILNWHSCLSPDKFSISDFLYATI